MNKICFKSFSVNKFIAIKKEEILLEKKNHHDT